MKKLISILVSLLIALSLFGCQKQQKQTEDIYIVFTSDVHCGYETNINWASLKSYVNSLKSEHNDVMLVDCGDYLQGGTIGTLSKGQYVVDLMNKMDYDIITIGNHEFDYSVDRLSELMDQMEAEIVLSNVIYTGSRENIFKDTPEYIIKEINGVKVGFIGLLTPTTPLTSTPSHFKENDEFVYDFYYGDDGHKLFNKTQEVVNEVRKQGAKYVVALSHLGSNETKSGVYTSINLIANTEGIDVVLDGHSHSVYTEERFPNRNGEDVVLSSVGTKLQEIGTLIIDTEGNISTMLISEYADQDQETLNQLEEVKKKLDVILQEKVGETEFDLANADEEGIRMCRSREVNAGDLMADAFRYETGTQIAFCNGGGVRTTIKAGDITYGDILDLAPFQNTVASIYATGQQILDFMEYSVMKTERIYKLDGNAVGEFGAFPQCSGIKYTIDTSKDAGVELDENGVFKQFTSDERRIKDVYVLEGDEYVPLDKDKTYTVGGISYLFFEPGDGNNIFNNCEPIIEEGITDVEAIKNYIEKFGVEQYRTTGDRIRVE